MPLLLIALVLAHLVAAVEQSMVFAAFKAIIEETGDPRAAGWMISAYFVVAGPAAVVAGRLGDMYGRKRVLLAVLAIVFAGSALAGLSHEMIGVIVGRGIQGVSGAIFPLCAGIWRENAPERRLGVGLGALLSAHTVGMMVGMLFGGMVVDHYHWRSIFLVTTALAFMVFLAVLALTPASPPSSPRRLDWWGLGAAPALVCLLFGMSSLHSPVISIPYAMGIIAFSLLLLALWAVHELRHDNPLVDLRAFRKRNIALANITSVVTSLGPSQIFLYFTLLAQQPRWTGVGFGLSASAAGGFMSPVALCSATLGAVAGYAMTRIGPQRVVRLGASLQVIGWSAAIFLNHSFGPFLALLFVCSAGSMTANVGITGVVTAAMPPERTGEGLGTVAVTRSFGDAIGSQLIALLLSLSQVTSAARPGKSFPDAAAHRLTLVVMALFALGTLAAALALRPSPPAPARKPAPEGATASPA